MSGSEIVVREPLPEELPLLAALAARLWPDHDPADLAAEFAALREDPEAALFLALAEGAPAGFAQCSLRHDYVEGTESSPVGYLEGIYTEAACRRRGIARALLERCEAWARDRGCREFASDCELTNPDSIGFHRASGFREANRIVCFVKPLKGSET